MLATAFPLQNPAYLPHGYCYLWNPGLLGLHVISDGIITLSYFSIPIGLVWLVNKRKDLPFNWMFWLFALFIAGCGTTHLMEIWTLWHPSYWTAGLVKGFTAVASVGTAFALVPLLPKAAALPTPAQLEQANRDLGAVNQELEGFAYSVSHDLRTPLRAIDGFAQAMIEDHGPALPADAREMLGTISSNSRWMAQLIDDLLNFSRLGRQPMAMVELDMGSLVRAAAAQLQQVPARGTPELRIAELPRARGDASLIHQVWANLLGNAFKFSGKNRPAVIEVSGRREGAEVVYSVKDNGIGFDMRHAENLFGVFQRLHSAKDIEGTGVGLALVQRIVQRHGGRIWAESRLDEGATFFFTLPFSGGEG